MCSDAREFRAAAAALCATLLLSCTVKEDRTECPCFLTVDMGGIEAAGLMGAGADSLSVAVGAEEDFYVREAFHLRDNVQEYTVAVPKARTDLLVACAAGRLISVWTWLTRTLSSFAIRALLAMNQSCAKSA